MDPRLFIFGEGSAVVALPAALNVHTYHMYVKVLYAVHRLGGKVRHRPQQPGLPAGD